MVTRVLVTGHLLRVCVARVSGDGDNVKVFSLGSIGDVKERLIHEVNECSDICIQCSLENNFLRKF